jgi:hypothetical protein
VRLRLSPSSTRTPKATNSVGGPGRTRACNQIVMSGRISVSFVDFTEFSYPFGCIRCVSIASFLVRNWCGVQEARIKRQTAALDLLTLKSSGPRFEPWCAHQSFQALTCFHRLKSADLHSFSTRAAKLTPTPKISSASMMMSPTLMPMRKTTLGRNWHDSAPPPFPPWTWHRSRRRRRWRTRPACRHRWS